jgi:hypothetical protein
MAEQGGKPKKDEDDEKSAPGLYKGFYEYSTGGKIQPVPPTPPSNPPAARRSWLSRALDRLRGRK